MSPPPINQDPSFALVEAAQNALADEKVRASVRQMHAEGYSLVKMVDALALDAEMDEVENLQKLIENLPPDVVTKIREATLAALDRLDGGVDIPRDENGVPQVLPIDCNVTQDDVKNNANVGVDVEPKDGVETVVVRLK
jgi:hypothetical protein